jgi:hypothetical protein
MGLDWRGQQAKIKSDTGYGDISIPLQTPSGMQEMACIPLTKLNGWLFSINKNKVHPDHRGKVITNVKVIVLYAVAINSQDSLHIFFATNEIVFVL